MHIDVSNGMLCFLTHNWFTNPPCVREIARAVLRKKPLVALLEADTSDRRGGHTEAECREILLSGRTIRTPKGEMTYAQLLETTMSEQIADWAKEWGEELQLPTGDEIVKALFESPALVWYRLADFQVSCFVAVNTATCATCPLAPS